jgi:hypothetical protein
MKFRVTHTGVKKIKGPAFVAVKDGKIVKLRKYQPPSVSREEAIKAAWRKTWCQYAQIMHKRMQRRAEDFYREKLIHKIRKHGAVYEGSIDGDIFQGDRVIE